MKRIKLVDKLVVICLAETQSYIESDPKKTAQMFCITESIKTKKQQIWQNQQITDTYPIPKWCKTCMSNYFYGFWIKFCQKIDFTKFHVFPNKRLLKQKSRVDYRKWFKSWSKTV